MVVVALSEAIPKPCLKQSDCDKDQCCLKIGNILNVCRSRVKKDGRCIKSEITKILQKDVYIGKCPCAEGLECTKKGEKGLSKLFHTCQPDGDLEIPDEIDETSDEEF